jgi:4'-phosphopantetheinyl transferase
MENNVPFVPFPGPSVFSLRLPPAEIQIWSAETQVSEEQLQRFGAFLSEDEHARANRFVFERDRERFIVCRGLLRTLLSGYTGLPPDSLRFQYGTKGKPELAGGNIHFNISHSAELVLLTFSRSQPLGIDVECIRVVPEAEQIAESHFSRVERAAFRSVPSHLKTEAFFNCWTRKEAFVKALGDGLYIPLGQFDVTIEPGAEAGFLAIDGEIGKAAAWSLYHLVPKPGFVGALAVAGRAWRPVAWILPSHQQLSP